MQLAAMLTSLPVDFGPALRQARQLGFTHVDIVGLEDRPRDDVIALADSGLLVSCAAVGRDLPEGITLDAAEVNMRRQGAAVVERQIADAARLGATCCYVVPGHDASRAGLVQFADACCVLADAAAARMMRLCVEHSPGRALPSVAATLAWLAGIKHDNLYLLLDVGHCLISAEDPAQCVAQAGQRLGYVHLDDNDSVADLHWPLLTGRLTSDMLEAVLTLLKMSDYPYGMALELNPKNGDPVRALADGKTIVERMAAQA